MYSNIRRIAAEAEILEEIAPQLERGHLDNVMTLVMSTGQDLAQSMGRDGRNLPYSFSVEIGVLNANTTAERELALLQELYRVVGKERDQQTSTATQT